MAGRNRVTVKCCRDMTKVRVGVGCPTPPHKSLNLFEPRSGQRTIETAPAPGSDCHPPVRPPARLCFSPYCQDPRMSSSGNAMPPVAAADVIHVIHRCRPSARRPRSLDIPMIDGDVPVRGPAECVPGVVCPIAIPQQHHSCTA
jgi:hypothetical protein